MIRSRAVRWLGALLVSAPVAVLSLRAQAPGQAAGPGQSSTETKPATGVLVGTVIDAGTGKPISGAAVSISGAAGAVGQRSSSLTGSDGRFLLTSLPEGAYTLMAQRGGYALGTYGAIGPQRGGVLVDLGEGEKRSDLVIKMWKPGSISGRIVDEAGDPLINVNVQAWARRPGRGGGAGAWAQSQQSQTDDRGMYRISGLLPNSYLIFVEQTHASLPTAVLDEFQKAASVPGVISRTSPIMTEVFASGANTAAPGSGGSRLVGDQVENIGGSALIAAVDPDSNAAYVSQFYPTAAAPATATPIVVTSGEEHGGIDLQLRPVRTVQLTGTVMGPAGPLPFTRVMVAPQHATDVAEASTVTDASGRFALLRVPEGTHVLKVFAVPQVNPSSSVVTSTIQNANGTTSTMASSSGPNTGVPPLPPDPALYAEVPITTADKDIADINIAARPGAHIKGRIEIPAGSTVTPAQMQRIVITLNRADGGRSFFGVSTPRTRVDGNGDVTSQGFQSGAYTVAILGQPSGWSIAAVMHGGVDVSQQPLDLTTDVDDLVFTFTTTPNELSGVVRDAANVAVNGALVMIFPADAPLTDASIQNPRRVTRPIASTTGKYSAKNLPPGEYFVAAMAPDDPENVSAPAGGRFSLESLTILRARATRIAIGAGEKRALDLVTRSR